MRARLIISAILLAAFCGSMVTLVLYVQAGRGTEIVPQVELSALAASANPTPPPLIEGTMPPRDPRVTDGTPASILNITDWKLTLPTGDDEPVEIMQPQLTSFSDPRYFHADEFGEGVVFRAPVGGATTANSNYPRSELREMTNGGRSEASWSGTKGTHVMTITQAITALPRKKPEVVAGQIHDEEDDVLMVRLNGQKLFVENDGDTVGVLDPAYKLGTRFNVQFVATPGLILVYYNGTVRAGLKRQGSDYYFKAGCYTQSNEDDDGGSVFGEVVIYGLAVQHS